jgi:hypothetical protein
MERTIDSSFPTASRRLRRITTPTDVVLGTYGVVDMIISPSGRNAFAPSLAMANPYVPAVAHAVDRDKMLAAIEAGAWSDLLTLASANHVTHVVTYGADECDQGKRLMRLKDQVGKVCMFALTPATDPPR